MLFLYKMHGFFKILMSGVVVSIHSCSPYSHNDKHKLLLGRVKSVFENSFTLCVLNVFIAGLILSALLIV